MLTLITSTLLLASSPVKVEFVKTNLNLLPLAFAPAPTGDRVAAMFQDGRIGVVDGRTGSLLFAMGLHPQPGYAVAWSRDGKRIASGDETGRVWVFDVATRHRLKEFRIHVRGVQSLCFDTTGKWLMSTGKDDAIGIYDMSTWKSKLRQGDGAAFYDAKYLPNSRSYVTATLRQDARLYNADGGLAKSFNGKSGQGALDCDVNPAGSLFATGGKDARATIWSISSGQPVASLQGHQDWVTAVKFSPNGKLLATSCGTDRTVKVWDVASKQAVATISNASAAGSPLGWTADGQYLLSSDISDHLQVQKVVGGGSTPVEKSSKSHGRRRHGG